jgi:hypothetical protein
MKAATVLEDLKDLGVSVWVEGDKLRYRGPNSVLNSDVLEQLKASKAEILALLNPPDAPREDPLGVRMRRIRDERRARGGAAADLDSVRTDKADFFSRDEARWREAWPRDFKVHGGGKA